MKLNYFKRKHHRAVIISLIILIISVNSCKKEFYHAKDGEGQIDNTATLKALQKIPDKDRIHAAEITQWVKDLPAPLTFPVQWKNAKENVINGKDIISIPVNKTAALFFGKQDGVIQAFAYKWQNKAPGAEDFTGNITSFNLQDYKMTGLVYEHSTLKRIALAPVTNSLVLGKVKTPGAKLKTNGIISDVFNYIVNALAEASCWLIGGDWSDFNNNTNIGNACENWWSYSWATPAVNSISNFFGNVFGGGTSGGGGGPGGGGTGTGGGGTGTGTPSAPVSTPEQDEETLVVGGGYIWVQIWTETPSGGCEVGGDDSGGGGIGGGPVPLPGDPGGCGGGGGSWVTYKIEAPDAAASAITNSLIETLQIADYSKQAFLQNHPEISAELYNYLLNNGTTQESKDFSNNYIDKLIGDADYLSFVINHSNTSSKSLVWWQDSDWLNDFSNFSLSPTFQNDIYYELNTQEKQLITIYPYQGYRIFRNKSVAQIETIARFGYNGLNDKSDAFRHAFFNAINQRDCGTSLFGLGGSIAKMYSDAHESETPANLILEKQMDLHNNAVGHLIYDQSGSSYGSTNAILSQEVINRLERGDLKYLDPLDITYYRGIIPGTTHLTPTNL